MYVLLDRSDGISLVIHQLSRSYKTRLLLKRIMELLHSRVQTYALQRHHYPSKGGHTYLMYRLYALIGVLSRDVLLFNLSQIIDNL